MINYTTPRLLDEDALRATAKKRRVELSDAEITDVIQAAETGEWSRPSLHPEWAPRPLHELLLLATGLGASVLAVFLLFTEKVHKLLTGEEPPNGLSLLVLVVAVIAAMCLVPAAGLTFRRSWGYDVRRHLIEDICRQGLTNPTEVALAQRLRTVTTGIEKIESWRADELAHHRAHLDLDETSRQIRRQLIEACRLRKEINGTSNASLRATATIDQVLISISTRITALETYYRHLNDLEKQRTELEHHQRLEAAVPRLTDLIAATTRDEKAIETTVDLSTDAQTTSATIQELLTQMDHEITLVTDHTDPA